MKKYLTFVKIEHTVFSLPLIYGGVLLARPGTIPPVRTLLLVLAAATGARTAAFALNRLIDREIDRRNPRTAGRELPSGRLTPPQAVLVLAAGLAVYLVSAWALGPICLVLSPIPLLVFATYPLLKRFTSLAHFGVGLALALGPLGGWIAATLGRGDPGPAILLSLFTLAWVAGFDIIYSTLDEEFDRREGLHSLPVRLGRARALRVSGLLHLAAFLLLGLLAATAIRSPAVLPFLALAGWLLFLEHRRAADVHLAFFRINAVLGFVVFGLVAAGVIGG